MIEDFETEAYVSIYCKDILDYVRDHWNWFREQLGEIDIICLDKETLVFVEVKTRSTLAFELPQEAVTPRKMRNLVEATDAYLQQHDIQLNSRFDIVSVLNGNPPKVIEHLIDAFQANDLI